MTGGRAAAGLELQRVRRLTAGLVVSREAHLGSRLILVWCRGGRARRMPSVLRSFIAPLSVIC